MNKLKRKRESSRVPFALHSFLNFASFPISYISCFENNVAVTTDDNVLLYSLESHSRVRIPVSASGSLLCSHGLYLSENRMLYSEISWRSLDGTESRVTASASNLVTNIAWDQKHENLLCRNPWSGWTTFNCEGRFLRNFRFSSAGQYGIAIFENLVYFGNGSRGNNSNVAVFSLDGKLVRSFWVPTARLLDITVFERFLILVGRGEVFVADLEGNYCEKLTDGNSYTCCATQSSLLLIGSAKNLECWR